MDAFTQEIIAVDDQYYLPCFGRRTPLVIDRGEGCYVYDKSGMQWLDLLGGIAVNVLGHNNEALSAAICEQSKRVIHCSNLYYNEPQAQLAAKLCELTGYDKIFFGNSGAEANEAAIKLARAYFYQKGENRFGIVSANQSFHGRTLATLTATGQSKFHKGFSPLPAGFSTVPINDIEALRAAVTPETCAVMLEPIQGESGVWPLTTDYLQAVRQLCDERGILLIFDEIQSGMGRTGSFLAAEISGVKADITTLAKGLGGGVPIGAILATDECASGFTPGMHGSTFGGNPLACAAALAVLDEYDRLDLMANAKMAGEYLQSALLALAAEGLGIAEVRGAGLMLAFDLTEDKAYALKDELFAKGVLVNSCTPRTIRLLPPLILNTEQVDDFVTILRTCLSAE